MVACSNLLRNAKDVWEIVIAMVNSYARECTCDFDIVFVTTYDITRRNWPQMHVHLGNNRSLTKRSDYI